MRTNQTSQALVSPVSSQSLADFMGGLDYDASMDAELQAYILAACEKIISITNHELLTRSFEFETDDFYSFDYIRLPSYPATAVTEFLADGEAVEFVAKLKARPAVVKPMASSNDYKITYSAGYANIESIPAIYIQTINMLACYIYDNRGCDMKEAIDQSGARMGIDVLKVRYSAI